MKRPYVLLSCAISLDGYLDDASSQRLLLSGEADFDRVDDVRSRCDAILVGAGTIRADNPRLMLRSQERRAARVARGLAADPVKVTITGGGPLDPDALFFTAGQAPRLVYATSSAAAGVSAGLAGPVLAGPTEVIDAGEPASLGRMLADLAGRGVGRLMVEGGASVLSQFLASGLADELQLAVAPFFVGDPGAPRFAGQPGAQWTPGRPARLVQALQVGSDALLRYALSDRFAED